MKRSEFMALPIGSRVRVTWSGGNGPHEYTTGVNGALYAPMVRRPLFVGWIESVRCLASGDDPVYDVALIERAEGGAR